MSERIRIVHTADNHIGKRFGTYKPEAKEALVEERFLALKRVVQESNDRKAHFLVVAGDLFDSIHVGKDSLKRTAEILNQFEGISVLIIPGNHDFYEDAKDSIWYRFRQSADDNLVKVLGNFTKEEFEVGDSKVVFFPAPCHSKTSPNHVIQWVIDAEKDPNALNIGIAHGNVEGRGLGVDRYFNMSPAELMNAGVECWLLGHIHVPYPENVTMGNPGFFFSGTHTPDDSKYRFDGQFWYLEFEANSLSKMEQVKAGGLKFFRDSFNLQGGVDIENMKNKILSNDPKRTLLNLKVSGKVDEANKKELDNIIKHFEEEFLDLQIVLDLSLRIDANFIDSHYSQNSLPYQLLASLSGENGNELALQLAHDLIEEVKK